MTRYPATVLALIAIAAPLSAATTAPPPPLLPTSVFAALAEEVSGENAQHTVEALALHQRSRGSRPLATAADLLAAAAREAGLTEVRFEELPADGVHYYGTQRSRPPWDADFAELWELAPEGDGWRPLRRLASWDEVPMSLAEDSESADVEAALVDVGDGTSESDYAGREVRGKIVLAAAQAGEVARLAVERYGAAGIVSYAQNQRTAWWKDDPHLVRWGHLDTFAPTPTFAFMVSLAAARELRARLAAGEAIRLRAEVRAGKHPGAYRILTASIPGADPELAAQEIVFSCHLDHPRPGANDNASGCAAILEAGRALARLVRDGRIPPPARTLRFVWPSEIEGTMALLVGRPEWAARLRAAIHLDMVGGGPETKAIFRVTRGPGSLPSFVHDVAAAIARFVDRQSERFASTGEARWSLIAPEGEKDALRLMIDDFTMGSDHEVYQEASFGIPAIYLNDWPDRYIHTTADRAANIDPTKLRRATFIAAASGWFLASMTADEASAVRRATTAAALRRAADLLERRTTLLPVEADSATRFFLAHEGGIAASIDRFVGGSGDPSAAGEALAGLERLLGTPPPAPPPSGAAARRYRRDPEVRGALSTFGFDFLENRIGRPRREGLALLSWVGERGDGEAYAYEVLNLADGTRPVQEIRDAVAAIYGPVPLAAVAEYLEILAGAGIVHLVE